MGMTSSTPVPDSQDVLIHSFQLDADNSYCAVSKLCPRKQAMFHVPVNVTDHIEHFLPLSEITKILEDLNEILKKTGFPLNCTNPVFILTLVAIYLLPQLMLPILLTNEDMQATILIPFVLIISMLPIILNFVLFFHCRYKRKNGILGYLEDWNRNDRGVKLNIGGFVTNPRSGVTLGSEQGGNYYHFYAAQFDRQSLISRGYLHVVVNRTQREAWCRNNGLQYVPPFTPEQQNMAAVQAAPYHVHQGYAMVPQQQFQVPPGYVLVPQSQVGLVHGTAPQDFNQPPPSYEMSNKMNLA